MRRNILPGCVEVANFAACRKSDAPNAREIGLALQAPLLRAGKVSPVEPDVRGAKPQAMGECP